ncbi:unnamed protein product [Nesidiocoris tenuis]|uniref:Uncharacterized protein n=1 Tax=Nesidiocoris tenuis TaxID=355587 RepID=A0A6H5FUK7_9HEMI|nr:unnamed protein product [Nesidiocoris tenuis]
MFTFQMPRTSERQRGISIAQISIDASDETTLDLPESSRYRLAFFNFGILSKIDPPVGLVGYDAERIDSRHHDEGTAAENQGENAKIPARHCNDAGSGQRRQRCPQIAVFVHRSI